MEYAKDKIFSIRYNKLEDVIEIREGKRKTLRNFIKQHKFMSIVIVTTVITIGVNCVLIHEFVTLLATL